jgi:hypothetical protein
MQHIAVMPYETSDSASQGEAVSTSPRVVLLQEQLSLSCTGENVLFHLA